MDMLSTKAKSRINVGKGMMMSATISITNTDITESFALNIDFSIFVSHFLCARQEKY